jgi:hypothetical protein
MFYISSSTATSTLSTSTVCFKSTNALIACTKKKKKRDIMGKKRDIMHEGLQINPSSSLQPEGMVLQEDKRDPRFLLYWATLTTTLTTTSFTATMTIYSLGCTPTGFGTSVC